MAVNGNQYESDSHETQFTAQCASVRSGKDPACLRGTSYTGRKASSAQQQSGTTVL
jgi:hypothetical protein